MKRYPAFFLAAIGAFFAPGSEVQAQQTLQTLLTTTITLQGQMSSQPSQTITVNLLAGNTYYFQAAYDVPFSNSNDPEQYLYSPSGAQLAFNDDWGNFSSTGVSFPTSLLPSPANTWSSFIGYNCTVSGAYTLKVTTFPWSSTVANPFSIKVSYMGNAVTPPPPPPPPGTTTGVPNVRLLQPSHGLFDRQAEVASLSVVHPVLTASRVS